MKNMKNGRLHEARRHHKVCLQLNSESNIFSAMPQQKSVEDFEHFVAVQEKHSWVLQHFLAELPSRGISLLCLFYYIQNNYMNFEEAEIDYSLTPTPKSKILGVIILTDNRTQKSQDKNNTNDFRCSAFKETQVDPLEFASVTPNHTQDENFMAQLTKRVSLLEARVEALSKLQGEMCSDVEVQRRNLKKKNRRKFRELIRDNVCPNCKKVYGSETALKYHVKLKHSPASNHSQAQ